MGVALREVTLLSTEIRYSLDGIDLQKMVLATYFIEMDAGVDVLARIKKVFRLIYPGTWTETGASTTEAREKHTVRIVGVYETPSYEVELPADTRKRRFIVQVAVPAADVGGSLALLLSFLAGEILAYGNVKLLDLHFPESYIAHFPGPKFGVEGLRQIVNVYERPLVLAIIKPGQGYTPAQGSSLFLEAARGGADIVKDEELLTDPSYCRRAERIRLYMKAEKQSFEETGERTLYAVNITDRVELLLSNANEAIELGANALMINYLQVGLEATRMVCEDVRVTVPILGHNSGATPVFASTHTGMSASLINGKFPRLCGIDLGIVLSGRGDFPALSERVLLVTRELLSPFCAIRPTLPVVANGIAPGQVTGLIREYGHDIALGAGSTIFGHPLGPAAGSRAFRQAIKAVLEGRKPQDAAEEYQELREALTLWGRGE